MLGGHGSFRLFGFAALRSLFPGKAYVGCDMRPGPGVDRVEDVSAMTFGNCQAGTLPVYRFFDNRNDANHRYTVDLTVRRAMINRKWVPEGSGPNAVAFCSPV